jgi:thiosulfate reductase cytochrome b subunit
MRALIGAALSALLLGGLGLAAMAAGFAVAVASPWLLLALLLWWIGRCLTKGKRPRRHRLSGPEELEQHYLRSQRIAQVLELAQARTALNGIRRTRR